MNLSVIIPNYNHAHFLTEAVASVLKQKRKPDEILIIDDGSTDHSVEVIEELSKESPLIRCIRNKKNLGVARSANICLEAARGKYIAPLAADDLLFPNFFSSALEALEKHPDKGMCCGKIVQFSNEAPPYQFIPVPSGIKDRLMVLSPDELKDLYRKTSYFIYSNGALFRRDALIKYGKYQTGMANLCDWYINNQIALNHGLIIIPEVFSALRISQDSFSMQIKKDRHYRENAYADLMERLDKGDPKFKQRMQSSGALGQLGVRMIQYLLKHPRYWSYLPGAIGSKYRFLKGHFDRS